MHINIQPAELESQGSLAEKDYSYVPLGWAESCPTGTLQKTQPALFTRLSRHSPQQRLPHVGSSPSQPPAAAASPRLYGKTQRQPIASILAL